MTTATAVLKHAKISPKKARLVADLIRGMPVYRAVDTLTFSPQKGAKLVLKVLNSAISNAENNHGLDIDELKVGTIFIDKGMVLKRTQARARGRSDRLIKRTSHITIIVQENFNEK